MRHSHAHYVELEAAQLPVGEQLKTVCPECQGGSSNERSLLVTREPWGLRAHCFRASCPFRTQVTGSAPGSMGNVPNAPLQEPTHYYGTYNLLEPSDVEYFHKRFHLDSIQMVIGYNDRNQYVMPMLNRFGLRTGYVVRQQPWSGLPAPRVMSNPYNGMARKVRAWPDTPDTVMLSIYPPILANGVFNLVTPGTIVLVEDQISAMKAAQAGATGVALIGVGLSLDKVRELQRLHPKRVLVALDGDAGHLAFQMVNKWSAAFPYMRTVLLDKDLKDMPTNDVLEVLGRGV